MAYNLHRTQGIPRKKYQLKQMVINNTAYVDQEQRRSVWMASSVLKQILQNKSYEKLSQQELTFLAVLEDNNKLWLAWFPKYISKKENYRPMVGNVVNINGNAYKIIESRCIEKRKYGAFELETYI